MILIASKSKPFLLTAKNTVRRGATLTEYDGEIDTIYKAVEDSVQSNIPIPNGTHPNGGWTFEEARIFVHEVVHGILKNTSEMQDDDDIFNFGCDRYVKITIARIMFLFTRHVSM